MSREIFVWDCERRTSLVYFFLAIRGIESFTPLLIEKVEI